MAGQKKWIVLLLPLLLWPQVGRTFEKILSLENAFIPEKGYTDNNNVEFTISGNLPNVCYQVGRTEVEKSENGKKIRIIQYINERNVLGCDKGNDKLLKFPIPFQKDVSLGQLNEGEYTLEWQKDSGEYDHRSFQVDKSVVATNVDDLLYAPISSVFIPEMVYETANGEAVLTGILPSTCMQLNPAKIKITHFKDVVVVQPEMDFNRSSSCPYSPRPLNQIISLGPLKVGKYLLHVRSMSGMAVSRIFNVIKAREVSREVEGK